MAKYLEVEQDVQEIFNKVLEKTSIPKWLEFRILQKEKQCEIYKIQKLNELYEFLSENVNFAIVLNTEMFDQLDNDQKELLFEEAICGVHVADNDKVTLEKCDFNTYTGLLQAKGIETMVRFKETCKALVDQMELKEKNEKEARAEKRKNKKLGL